MENKLRAVRKAKGMTQAVLAQKANVCRTVIARHETGKTEMSVRNLLKVADALGSSIQDIVGGGKTKDGKIA